MNTSSYIMYQNHTLYKFKNQTETIGIEPLIVPRIDIQNLICIGPPKYSKVIISDDIMHTPPSSINYANLISRRDIFQPSYIIANLPKSNVTKSSRLGVSTSTSSPSNRRMVFTRGLKNVE